VGADIGWQKNNEVKRRAMLQPVQVRALRDVIDLTSDVEIDENEMDGVMLGYDDKTKAFRFQSNDDDRAIRGLVSDQADVPMPVQIPGHYRANIRTTSQVHYATERSSITNELIGLSRL